MLQTAPYKIIPNNCYVIVNYNLLLSTKGILQSGGYQADIYMYAIKLDDPSAWDTKLDGDIVILPFWQVRLDEERMANKK